MNQKSKKFDIVKKYFDAGVWSIAMVRNAVVKEWITPAEYELITEEVYA